MREGCFRQLDGCGNVRVVRVELAFDLFRHLHVVVEWRDFDGRLAPEHDHAHLVLRFAMLTNRGVDVVDHGLALGAGNAQGLVDQVDHGQPVVAADDLQLGRGQNQQQHNQGAQGADEDAPQRAERRQAAMPPPPEKRNQNRKREKGGAIEADAVAEHASGPFLRRVRRKPP